jgi:hypothetical protein
MGAVSERERRAAGPVVLQLDARLSELSKEVGAETLHVHSPQLLSVHTTQRTCLGIDAAASRTTRSRPASVLHMMSTPHLHSPAMHTSHRPRHSCFPCTLPSARASASTLRHPNPRDHDLHPCCAWRPTHTCTRQQCTHRTALATAACTTRKVQRAAAAVPAERCRAHRPARMRAQARVPQRTYGARRWKR